MFTPIEVELTSFNFGAVKLKPYFGIVFKVQENESKMAIKRTSNPKEKSLAQICDELRDNLDGDSCTINQSLAKRNLRELLTRSITAEEILNFGMLEIVDEMTLDKDCKSTSWFLSKLKNKFKKIVGEKYCPRMKTTKTLVSTTSTRKRTNKDEIMAKKKTTDSSDKGRTIYEKSTSQSLNILIKKVKIGLDPQFKVTNKSLVTSAFSEILKQEMTISQINKSGLIKILHQMNQNKENGELDHLIKEVAAKIKVVLGMEKGKNADDKSHRMSGIQSKFDVEIEEQCPIETKSKSSFEDTSCKEISRKRTSSTIQGEEKTKIQRTDSTHLRQRILMTMNSEHEIVNSDLLRSIFDEILKGEVSLSEIRQSGLIDVLEEMLDNKDNAPLKKLLIQVAMKVKEAFNQTRSKEGRATKPKLNKPIEVEAELSDTDSSDRDSNAISEKRTESPKRINSDGEIETGHHNVEKVHSQQISESNKLMPSSRLTKKIKLLKFLLDSQYATKSLELVDDVLSEISELEMTVDEIKDSDLITTLLKMASNEENEPLIDIINKIGKKIAGIYNWQPTEMSNISIENKSGSQLEDKSLNESISKRKSKPSIEMNLSIKELCDRLKSILDEKFTVRNHAMLKRILSAMIKREITLSEIRNNNLVNILSQVRSNHLNIRHKGQLEKLLKKINGG
ncbi:hypothetical protein ACOME3_000344 [Neoechinorhynchus agilis]